MIDIETALVLCCPDTIHRYQPHHLRNIKSWIDFFVFEKHQHVIATLPSQHQMDVAHLRYDPSVFLFQPVSRFETCDRWRVGLEKAMDCFAPKRFMYLWSADFHFNDAARKSANLLLDNKENADLLVGTIKASGRKEEIDQYATYPLIQNWFPEEYETLRQTGYSKPRSELLRFSTLFLLFALSKRWYPTEQTIHLILQCFWDSENFKAAPLPFYEMHDTDDDTRAHPNVIQQVDRMEVWLKYMWRERQTQLHRSGWEYCRFLQKCIQSFDIVTRAYSALLEGSITAYWDKGDRTSCQVTERQMIPYSS